MFLEIQASTIIDTKELVSCQGSELSSRFNMLKQYHLNDFSYCFTRFGGLLWHRWQRPTISGS
jgi:hypothetical protein